MTRKANKIAVFTISILTAGLISDLLFNFLIDMGKFGNAYISTFIGMLIKLAIFYPIITIMNTYLKKLTEGYIKVSKKVTKKSSHGILWAFLVAFIILYYFYLRNWTGIDLIDKFF